VPAAENETGLLVKILRDDAGTLQLGAYIQRAYSDDCGLDLYVQPNLQPAVLGHRSGEPVLFADAGSWVIAPGEFVDLPLGVAIQLPPATWAMLTGRSSTLRKRGLLVAQGIIDHGYRGPLFVEVWNLTDHDVLVEAGAKLAQLIVLPAWSGEVALVAELDDHPRGHRGFGSSGA
jgi:dUTP pyrophosphatase